MQSLSKKYYTKIQASCNRCSSFSGAAFMVKLPLRGSSVLRAFRGLPSRPVLRTRYAPPPIPARIFLFLLFLTRSCLNQTSESVFNQGCQIIQFHNSHFFPKSRLWLVGITTRLNGGGHRPDIRFEAHVIRSYVL